MSKLRISDRRSVGNLMRLFPLPAGRVREVEIAVRRGEDQPHELRIEAAPSAASDGAGGATEGEREPELSHRPPEADQPPPKIRSRTDPT